MFHASDLSPPQLLICNTPANPMDSVQHPMLLQDVQGKQAEVYRANMYVEMYRANMDVAVKMMNPNHFWVPDDIFELEVALMRTGVPVAELLSCHQWNEFGMSRRAAIYRYYAGGDMFTHICRLALSKAISAPRSESIAFNAVKMMCTCLAQVHLNGWVHLDIKAENIFLSQDIESPDCQAYLGDFGMAVRVGTPISPLMCGSQGYFPKQDFSGFGFMPAQTSIDLYSVGQVLRVFQNIHKLSPHGQAVIKRLVAPAAERPTAAEMLSTHLPQWLSHIQEMS